MTFPLLKSQLHKNHAPAWETDSRKIIPYNDVPNRVDKICQGLEESGLVQIVEGKWIPSLIELSRIHSPEMVAWLQEASKMRTGRMDYAYAEMFATRPEMMVLKGHPGRFAFDPYAPIGAGTFSAVQASAGLALEGAELIIKGDCDLIWALCRPPGHHAGADFYGGYCYLNNAALAADRLKTVGRVAVLDLDYHHGNGTQSIFWNDPDVFFSSLHADPAFEYPHYSGFAVEAGGENAPGTNLNFPLPKGTRITQYMQALEKALVAIGDFDPKNVVVSLGFDTVEGDPTGTFALQPDDYLKIGRKINELAVPLLIVQEGGYRLDVLARQAEMLGRGLVEGHEKVNKANSV